MATIIDIVILKDFGAFHFIVSNLFAAAIGTLGLVFIFSSGSGGYGRGSSSRSGGSFGGGGSSSGGGSSRGF